MSLKRAMKNFKKRSNKAASFKLEQLSAAFVKEVGPELASRSKLCSSVVMEEGVPVTQFWFTTFEPTAAVAEQHPDIQYMFDLMIALTKAYNSNDNAAVKEGFELALDLLEKYEDEYKANVLLKENTQVPAAIPEA